MRLLPVLLVAACTPRYLCAPGTEVEGEWCVPADDSGDTGAGVTDTDSADTGGPDDSGDSGETGDSADSGDTGEAEPARLVVNEYMTSNDTKAVDEFGEFDDFVEVYNAGGQPADLGIVALTDDTEVLGLFRFPAGTSLAPGAFVVVWADGTPEQGEYHALFTLQSAADRILLVQDPEGAATVLDDRSFADMGNDVSAARVPDGSELWVTTETVTPGAQNAE